MKKIRLIWPVLALLLLCACGGTGGDSKATYSPQDAQDLIDAGAFTGEMEEVDGDVAAALYGLDASTVTECKCFMAVNTAVSADEVAVLVLTDEKAADAAVAACKARVDSQIESCTDYAPAAIPGLENAVILRRGYTVLFAVGDPDKLPQALSDLALTN